MAVFAAGLKGDGDAAEPKAEGEAEAEVQVKAEVELPPQAAARAEQTMAGLPYFVGRIVPAFMSYTPDVDRLEALSDQLVLAAGEDSRGELAYRPAALLADRLGTDLVHFPGGHIGLTTHPARFGELLRETLRADCRPGDSCPSAGSAESSSVASAAE